MSKMQLQEDINDIPDVIDGEDLIAVLKAAKLLMEWSIPYDVPGEFIEEWKNLSALVDKL